MLARRLALAAALFAALVGSQAPEFAQQYRQRLGGAIDELRAIAARFQAEAARQGLSPPAAVQRLEQNSDALARQRGEAMAGTLDRLGRLETQAEDMAAAGPIGRIWAMAWGFDPQIARRALDAYEPAAPLTLEAAVVAAISGLGGWAVVRACGLPFARRRRAPPGSGARA